MKDLRINPATGDLVLARHDLQLVSGAGLTTQKAQMILGTNKSEWELNSDEGINFRSILVKNPDYDEILDTIRDGLRQVDESFRITEYSFTTKQRHLAVNFKAINDSGEEISLSVGEVQVGGTGTNEDNWLIRALADLVEVE